MLSSLTLVIMVKVSIGASHSFITLYTAEVYPTVVRCTGVSFCYCVARLGTVATSYVAAMVNTFLTILRNKS